MTTSSAEAPLDDKAGFAMSDSERITDLEIAVAKLISEVGRLWEAPRGISEGAQPGGAAMSAPFDDAPARTSEGDLLAAAWGIIANAGWDDCAKSPGWQEAAVRWRDDYHAWLRDGQP